MQIAASEYRSAANKIQTTLKRKFRGDEPTKELAKVWPGHPPQAILFELFDHAADLIRNDVYKSIFVELPNILHIPPVELYGQDLADLFFGNDLPSAAAEKEKEVVVLDAEYRAAASTLKRVLSSRFKSSMPSHELARIWPHHPPQAMLYDLFHEPLSILRDPSRIDLLLKLASVLELSADKLYGEKLAGMFAAAADHAAKLAAQEAAIDGAASSDLDIPADSNVAITALQTKENKAPAPDGVSATEIDQPSHEVAHPTSADVDIIAADGLPLAREVPKPDVASALELHLSPSDDVSIPSPYIPDLEENKIPTQHGVATSEAAYPLSDADIAADALSPADLPLAQDEASAFEKGQFLNSGADIITRLRTH